jgi:hypothetical protein
MVESFKMIQYLKKRLCVSNKAQFSGTVPESCALHFNISYTLFCK